MRMLAGVLCCALVGPAAAQTAEPNDASLIPIHQFLESFNKGDLAAAKAAHAADVSIQDEVPPYVWRGAGAFDAWAADLDTASKTTGMTDMGVVLGKPDRVEVTGDDAYVVMPATLNFRQKGKPMAEPARMVFSLHQEAGNWKIRAWSWAGEAPHPVAAGSRAKAPKPATAPAAK